MGLFYLGRKNKENVKLGEAVQIALNQVIGAYAIAVIDNEKPETLKSEDSKQWQVLIQLKKQ